MPTGSPEWPRFNYEDPEDRRILIENGIIWKCSRGAQQLAVEDFLAARVPMNDKVPPQIADYVRKQRGEPTLGAHDDEPSAGVPEPEHAHALVSVDGEFERDDDHNEQDELDAEVADADLGDTDEDAAERCRRLFLHWAHEARMDGVRWVMKASGPTGGDVAAYATFVSRDIRRIMPLIREKHRNDPDWDRGQPDEFAAGLLRSYVTDRSMAYRTRGVLGSGWKSWGRLSQAAQGKFEGEAMQMITLSRARLAARVAKFNEKFSDRPLPTTKGESDQLLADMFSEILGRRVDTPKRS